MIRRLALLAVVVLVAGACQVRRTPAPAGVALLRVGTPQRLTDRAALSPAAWSPDGRALAYADRDGLWVATLDGRERKVTAAGVATQVDWSRPTGLLAFIHQGEVSAIRADGSGRRRLVFPASAGPLFATRLAWAPGSDRLAVAVQARRGPIRAAVWLFSADGRFRRQVFPGPPVGGAGTDVVSALGWFPDSLFLFIGLEPERGGGVTRLWRWRVAYLDRRVLRLPFAPAFAPRLSPDGRWIAFIAPERVPGAGEHVWAVRADGSAAPRRLSPQSGRFTGLAWAPTSDKVAFARVLDEAHGEIWLADVDGGGRVRAAEFVAEFPDPNLPVDVRWSGSGRHLAYGSNSGSYTGPVWIVSLARR